MGCGVVFDGAVFGFGTNECPKLNAQRRTANLEHWALSLEH
jgi:hypothetical protein